VHCVLYVAAKAAVNKHYTTTTAATTTATTTKTGTFTQSTAN